MRSSRSRRATGDPRLPRRGPAGHRANSARTPRDRSLWPRSPSSATRRSARSRWDGSCSGSYRGGAIRCPSTRGSRQGAVRRARHEIDRVPRCHAGARRTLLGEERSCSPRSRAASAATSKSVGADCGKVPRSRSHGRTPPPPSVHQRLSKLRNFGLTLHRKAAAAASGPAGKRRHITPPFFNSRRIGLSSPASRSAASSDNSGWWATRASADSCRSRRASRHSVREESSARARGTPQRRASPPPRSAGPPYPTHERMGSRGPRRPRPRAGGGLAQPLGSARLQPR